MNTRAYRTFQALILGALGLFLLFKISDGRILLYINQRFVILVLLAGLGLIILSQVALRERPPVDSSEQGEGHEDFHDHSGDEGNQKRVWGLWLLALPLLIGVFIPQRALGAGAIQNRGINPGVGWETGSRAAQIPEQERNVLDWVRLSGAGAIMDGQKADVTGFVYHDPRLGQGAFLVGRFTIACCVADAVAYGMAVQWPGAKDLPDNRWVRVRGVVSQVEVDGRLIPLIEAEQVDILPEPEQPYLFP